MAPDPEEDRSDDVELIYQRHWRDIIEPYGIVDIEAMKRELYDYWQVLSEVPKVYDDITGGMVTRPDAPAYHVIAVAYEHFAKLDEAYAENDRLRAQVESNAAVWWQQMPAGD